MWFAAGESASPDGYEITYVVDEPRRVTGGITTLVGTNEGSLVTRLLSVVTWFSLLLCQFLGLNNSFVTVIICLLLVTVCKLWLER